MVRQFDTSNGCLGMILFPLKINGMMLQNVIHHNTHMIIHSNDRNTTQNIKFHSLKTKLLLIHPCAHI